MGRKQTKATSGEVLVLRTCDASMRAYDGFEWPTEGPVECQDWDPKPECGNGLHGLLWGEGDGSLLDWDETAKWLVVSVPADTIVSLDGGEVKFPRGRVVYCGDRKGATDYITEHGGRGPVVGCFRTGGDNATVTGGYRATVTGCDHATVTGGYRATVAGGDYATVTGGHRATVTGGDYATVTGGNWATVTGGDGAKVSGGKGSILSVKWHDGTRYRLAVAYVGENGIKPNVKYRVNFQGEWVEA